MSCEYYWRKGVLLAEREDPDPHLGGCMDCLREHRRREEMLRALPLVGASVAGDPTWEAKVWSRIAREAPGAARLRWYWSGLLATAVAALLLSVVDRGKPPERPEQLAALPEIELISGGIMRSVSPSPGDTMRAAVSDRQELRVYRDGQLLVRCGRELEASGCRLAGGKVRVELVLAEPGEYRLVAISARAGAKGAAAVGASGQLERDLMSVVNAGGEYHTTVLSVR
jgi:hypothetical protein